MTASVAFQYSSALMKVTTTQQQIEESLNAFQNLVQLLNQSPELDHFLSSPIYSDDAKKQLLTKLLKTESEKNVLLFLFLLIDKKRMTFLKAILQKYTLLAKQKLGIEEVKLITAIPLEHHVEMQLKNKLEKFFQKKIEIIAQVSPEIIGGAIFIIGQRIVDYSIRNRLTKIKEDLLAIKLK